MPDEVTKVDKKTRELRRLTLAMRGFGGALEMCRHIIALKLTERDALYSPCVTGMVVNYSRPFGGSDGIGMLSSIFTKFEEPNFRAAHQELLLARDTFHAHYDALRVGELTVRDNTHIIPYETTTEFRLDPDEKIRIYPSVNVPEITPDSMPGFTELFLFQMDRVFAAQTALLKSMASPKTYDLGTYTLGRDFP